MQQAVETGCPVSIRRPMAVAVSMENPGSCFRGVDVEPLKQAWLRIPVVLVFLVGHPQQLNDMEMQGDGRFEAQDASGADLAGIFFQRIFFPRSLEGLRSSLMEGAHVTLLFFLSIYILLTKWSDVWFL